MISLWIFNVTPTSAQKSSLLTTKLGRRGEKTPQIIILDFRQIHCMPAYFIACNKGCGLFIWSSFRDYTRIIGRESLTLWPHFCPGMNIHFAPIKHHARTKHFLSPYLSARGCDEPSGAEDMDGHYSYPLCRLVGGHYLPDKCSVGLKSQFLLLAW